MTLEELPTPAALVDLDRLERNAAAMARRAHQLGVRLRPHVKTHKCIEAARLQVAGHFGGITVSTLAEARAFAEAGFRDISYAVPPAPQRLASLAALARRVERLNLLLDHPALVEPLAAAARSAQVTLGVFLKVDSGLHRAGLSPDDPRLEALAARLAATPHLHFQGLLTHAGHAYHCRGWAEVRQVARQEHEVMVSLAERLRARGIEVPEVSVGSTPTVLAAENFAGVSEVRPGNYLFFDAFQAALGSCTVADCAFTVLATVVGSYPERRAAVIDAGALALSKDDGAPQVAPRPSYGIPLPLEGTDLLPHLRITSLTQEHGVVTVAAGGAVPPIGQRLRIVPNHSCLAAALFDRFFVVRGTSVVGEWRPVRGWE